jgi:hypothetical protein
MPTAISALLLLVATSAAAASGTWHFRVLLDGREVGWHEFRLREAGGGTELTSRAELDVRILFISAYTYRHEAVETWRGECLERLEATTDDNGTRSRVRGERSRTGFVVTGDAPAELPPCVMTFAYWKPDFLRQSSLLNPQTGRYVPVRAAVVGKETIIVRGTPRQAVKRQLFAEGGVIDLWYSLDGEWLGLASRPKGKHRLEYRLQ